MRLALILLTLLALTSSPLPSAGAPAPCAIVEGAGIAGVQIGMASAAALALTGPPVRQETTDTQVLFTLRPPWSQMVADRGMVETVSTTSSHCRTAGGVGPGSSLVQVRQAYAGTEVSTLTTAWDAQVLAYPFRGIAFRVQGDRVELVEVFRARRLPPIGTARATPSPAPSPGFSPTAPGAPTPTPTVAPGAWGVRSSETRVENGTLVISGVVQNRGRPLAAYADVRVLDDAGQQVGRAEAPLQPALVPAGGTAAFQVRISIDRVVRRYLVTIRPAGSPTIALVEASGEIRDQQQFAAMAARQVTVEIRSTAAVPTKDTFVVLVTNGSPLAVEAATVIVEMSVTCRVAGRPALLMAAAGLPVAAAPPSPTPPPTPPPTPAPTPRTIQEMWTGTVAVTSIAPRSTTQVAVPLSGGVCLAFTTWSARARVTDVRVAQ